jgi:hypothetical protein
MPIDVASALILAFVTLLPGWPAAGLHDKLSKIHELKQTGAALMIEYREAELRIAGLRECIDAKSPADFRLIDERERLRAIYEQEHRQLTDGRTEA